MADVQTHSVISLTAIKIIRVKYYSTVHPIFTGEEKSPKESITYWRKITFNLGNHSNYEKEKKKKSKSSMSKHNSAQLYLSDKIILVFLQIGKFEWKSLCTLTTKITNSYGIYSDGMFTISQMFLRHKCHKFSKNTCWDIDSGKTDVYRFKYLHPLRVFSYNSKPRNALFFLYPTSLSIVTL